MYTCREIWISSSDLYRMEVQRKRLWIVYQFVYRQSIYRSNPNYQHTNLMRFLSCCTPLINKSFLLMVRKHNILQSYIYQIFYLFCFIIIKMQKSKSCTSLIWTLFLQKKSKLRRQFIAYFGMLVVIAVAERNDFYPPNRSLQFEVSAYD